MRTSGPFVVVLASLLLLILMASAPATATEAEPETGTADDPAAEGEVDPAQAENDELLREGAEVYSQFCSSCHQPGGLGLSGQYPPLLDNPAVDDSAYLEDVIANGLQGELTALGETFNGVMPPFSTLSEGDVDAVVGYIQADFAAPVGGDVTVGPTGPVAGTELPGPASLTALAAYLLAIGAALLVLAPRLIGVNDRLSTPWLDTGLKTASIVVIIVMTMVLIPNWALQTSFVADLDRPVQDLIGLSLWGTGLLGCLWALWFAHRESRI